jgi:hypothetical protein
LRRGVTVAGGGGGAILAAHDREQGGARGDDHQDSNDFRTHFHKPCATRNPERVSRLYHSTVGKRRKVAPAPVEWVTILAGAGKTVTFVPLPGAAARLI